ncbi:extracellular ligand-binding receptor [Haloferax elongans ATCC BAA-1513]|uniref:Extracellular ligand-binding receptor n=1 Tax=Haloferax elongans ATCC BAA-1513 TaxID=1230453 RepID=M0HQR5_HALEO|nr:ABC transporter substrate-binding protein [Haloferax elongans]ELZ86032.1 extracellular ligand-binding receptor [Haloferax elongans ATCC BAA-1513]
MLAAGLAGCVGTEGNGDGNGATPTDEPTDGDTMDGTTTEMAGPERVLIGQPASLTGQWDFLQPAVSQSTDLAVQEINEAGGPLDATFEVQRRDTAVDPQQARQVVRQLVDSDEVHAIAHV